MTIEACTTFLHELVTSDEIKQQMKAMTDTKEVISLGKRHGFTFDTQEFIAASRAFSEGGFVSSTAPQVKQATNSAFYHYEFDMQQIPGFEQVTEELHNLKIKPPTVDMNLYRESFNEDDLQFTSMSPAAPQFGRRYAEVMQSHWQNSLAGRDFSRRDFHLINLDQHTEHALYDQYFQAKARIIARLEDFFASEVRFSGSLWYPPLSYRLWHTNETQAGWRMYIIDFDEPTATSHGIPETSFFRYMNPQTKEIVTLEERPQLVRFFKIEQEKDKLFWHCIVNSTSRNRWSFGFAVPENWIDRFPIC